LCSGTFVGHLVPAWQAKVREYGKPKFYFFDPGVERFTSGQVDGLPVEDFLSLIHTDSFYEARSGR
jgi:hypothetical protein